MIHEWEENRAKGKKEEGRRKRVWKSGDGEAENEWLNVKMKIYFNRDERER